MREHISVVVPTLNEQDYVERALRTVPHDAFSELIVVDGGSVDDTVSIARKYTSQVYITRAERACQMNLGARNATGQLLLFLHADTRLADNALNHIRAVMRAHDDIAGGGFSIRPDSNAWPFRLMAKLSTWRSKGLGWIYGDQGIFVRRSVFEKVGGYREMSIMEDFDFIRRIRREGRLVVLNIPVEISTRRWKGNGFIRTTLSYWLVLAGYLLGIRAEWLSRLVGPYHRLGKRKVSLQRRGCK